MKRMTILILMLIVFKVTAYCPQDKRLVIFEAPAIQPYEALWNAHCAVESNFDPDAIGDLMYKEYSYGIVQIRRSRLLDYYLQTGIWYDVKDMFDVIKSKEIWLHYALKYNPWEVERIAREWNGGPRGMKKRATVKYYKKILAAL